MTTTEPAWDVLEWAADPAATYRTELAVWRALTAAGIDTPEPAAPTTLVAVDPDGYPAPVAAGELIESAWGNAVVSKLAIVKHMPYGVRGFKLVTPVQAGIATVDVALTGLRVDYTEVIGRAYVVLTSALLHKGTSDITAMANVSAKRNGSTLVGRGQQRMVADAYSTAVAVGIYVGTVNAPAYYQGYAATAAGFVDAADMVLIVAELGSTTYP